MEFRSGEWVEAPVVQQAQPVQQPEKRMVAVLPFVDEELEPVINFLKRSLQLSGQISRAIYLLPIKGFNSLDIKNYAEAAFAQVGFIQDSEGKSSDWQGRELIRDAAGPNSLFRQASWFFYTKKIGPWLWLEPDCWPMTNRWFYDLEREYFETGNPFMGVKMAASDGREYMNGVAVYPWNAVQYAPLLIQSSTWTQHPEMEVGFDIAGGKDVLAKAHITRKIQLMGALAGGNANVRPETVLCHGRIDLSGGGKSADESEGARISVTCEKGSAPPAQKPFLDRYGVARDAQTEVFGDASPHAAPCVPSHETPVQESMMPREYGGISEEIRHHVQKLVEIWHDQPHRKVLIVKELRKARLVPKHFR